MTEYHAHILGQVRCALDSLVRTHASIRRQDDQKRVVKNQLERLFTELHLSLWSEQNLGYALFYEYFKSQDEKLADTVKEVWQDAIRGTDFHNDIPDALGELCASMEGPSFNLPLLPKPSFALAFQFTLAKPYISGDEPQVYIIDNPIVKDRLFGMPMVKPSTWTGHLRHAMREMLEWQPGHPDGEVINRLFGPLKDEAELAQGYLHFYPTFFKKVSLEVINPHDRKTRVGKVPIPFEAVPACQSGEFYLLYSPVGAKACALEHVKCDLKAVARGVAAMFTLFGFSAKKTDGYGVAKERLSPAGEMPMLWTNDTQIAEELNWDSPHDDGTSAIEQIPSFAALKVL